MTAESPIMRHENRVENEMLTPREIERGFDDLGLGCEEQRDQFVRLHQLTEDADFEETRAQQTERASSTTSEDFDVHME